MRRTFSTHNTINSKKQLYISLVRSQLLYIAQFYGNHILSNTYSFSNKLNAEQLSTYSMISPVTIYKTRLLKLQLLPLMYTFDLSDVMFFIKSYKSPHAGFDITKYISFATGNTQHATHYKLNQTRFSDNITKIFYFNRLPRIWNHLPVIDLDLNVLTIKQNYVLTFGITSLSLIWILMFLPSNKNYVLTFGITFYQILPQISNVLTPYCLLVLIAASTRELQTLTFFNTL